MKSWNQWPSGTLRNRFSRLIHDLLITNNHERRARIEEYFYRLTGYEVIVFSSARNALFTVVEALEMSRNSKVYIPPYSALCLYECFGRKINISTDLMSPDLVLINHKWGTHQITNSNNETALLIEDSCDAFLGSEDLMFPNNGRVQVISLPKILGTVSGGLLFFRDSKDPLLPKLRQMQMTGKTRNSLFLKKYVYYRFDMKRQKNWEQIEFESRGVSWADTLQILNALPEYDSNRRKLQARRDSVASLMNKVNPTNKYLGPVAIISSLNSPLDVLTLHKGSILKIYHLDCSFRNGENKPYSEVAIFPIHLGISDKVFNENLMRISDLINQGHIYDLIN